MKEISLSPVIREDLDVLFGIKVAADQEEFVATNAITLAEIHYITGGYVFTIRHHSVIVGLLAMIDFSEHDELFEDDDPNAAFLLRLMIEASHQRRGYGREAVKLAIDWARSRGNSAFQTSIVPGNDDAREFYESIGLRETGRIVEDEVEMSMFL